MTYSQMEDRLAFESAIRALEAQIANASAHLAIDAPARHLYETQIKAMSDSLRTQAESGKITWAKAAREAQETRNVIMEVMRGRSSPVGRAIAEKLKLNGKTLNEMIARKAQALFGSNVVFDRLSPQQQGQVYAEIVKSAGKSDPRISASKLSIAAKSLIFVTLAFSAYNIATAEDKVDAAKKEALVTTVSITSGIAGGALAGLACGPGAPVCVTLGAFVGGALGAFGVNYFW